MSKFLCPRCPKQFQSENDLKRHLIKMHGVEGRMKGKPEANQSKPTEAKTSCDICRNSGNCDDLDRKECDGHAERWVSEAEFKALQDVHKKAVEKLGEITGRYITKNEKLEGENKKLQTALKMTTKLEEAERGRLSESEGKNREYAKLVAAQAEEYTERLSAIDLLEKAQPKTLPEMPHRFMDKLQPESTSSYLSRLFIFCYQNRLDLPKQWVSEAYFKAEREKDTELMSQATQRIIAFRELIIEKDNKIERLEVKNKKLKDENWALHIAKGKAIKAGLNVAERLEAIKEKYEAMKKLRTILWDEYQHLMIPSPQGPILRRWIDWLDAILKQLGVLLNPPKNEGKQ